VRGPGPALVRTGSTIAALGAIHAAINARLLRRAPAAGTAPSLGHIVAVLIPARDEAAQIDACLGSVLTQRVTGFELREIAVLDDESTDGTAAHIAAYLPRVRLIHGAGPPPGWLGKPAACAALAESADPACDVLVFLDADVELAPDAIGRAIALMDQVGLDLVSPYPRQVADGPGERLIQPLLQWSWLTFLPLRLAERSARPSLGAANGQFLVVRRAAYAAAGGHGSVRGEVLEDMALLRSIKAAGGTGTVVDGTDLASCRMYRDGSALADGYAKSLWSAFGSPLGAISAIAFLMVGYVFPGVAMLRGSRIGAAGYLAAVAGRVITGRRTGARVWPDAAAHPLSIVALAVLTARSLRGRRRGTLEWRGRALGRPSQ
jgi:glycosyltransferase involved in cell wall biosynthesis